MDAMALLARRERSRLSAPHCPLAIMEMLCDDSFMDYNNSIITRILNRSRLQPDGCIEYPAVKHPYGCISITINRVRTSATASRAMYMAVNNCFNLPGNIMVRHTCDNQRCVNIDHLLQGSAQDNMQDCIDRERRAAQYKYHHRTRIHNNDKVAKIRAANGFNVDIAAEFNVSASYASKIRNGKLKR